MYVQKWPDVRSYESEVNVCKWEHSKNSNSPAGLGASEPAGDKIFRSNSEPSHISRPSRCILRSCMIRDTRRTFSAGALPDARTSLRHALRRGACSVRQRDCFFAS